MYERNIANVTHDLKPLLRSLRNKLSLLKETARETEYQKVMKQIKLDTIMTDKYILGISQEVKDFGLQLSKNLPRNIANIVLDLTPMAKSLKDSLTALDDATRASDYVKALKRVNEVAKTLEEYLTTLEEEAKKHSIEKAKGVPKLLNIEI